jgi:hypothetical protein
MTRTALWLALGLAGDADASGSSHAMTVAGPLWVHAETPSISFADEGDEREFHTSWRDAAEPLVQGATARAAAEVASWPRRERRLLTAWRAELPVAQSWIPASEPGSLEATAGPVVYSAPLGLPDAPPMTVAAIGIAFAEPPPRAVADALIARLQAAVTPPTARPEADPAPAPGDRRSATDQSSHTKGAVPRQLPSFHCTKFHCMRAQSSLFALFGSPGAQTV